MRSIYKTRSSRKPSAGAPSRREHGTVVHPWLALPERLAAAQAAMLELAGQAAFRCPMGEMYNSAPPAREAREKRETGVNIIVRKRRFAHVLAPGSATAG